MILERGKDREWFKVYWSFFISKFCDKEPWRVSTVDVLNLMISEGYCWNCWKLFDSLIFSLRSVIAGNFTEQMNACRRNTPFNQSTIHEFWFFSLIYKTGFWSPLNFQNCSLAILIVTDNGGHLFPQEPHDIPEWSGHRLDWMGPHMYP